jgi:hypothetical protein
LSGRQLARWLIAQGFAVQGDDGFLVPTALGRRLGSGLD